MAKRKGEMIYHSVRSSTIAAIGESVPWNGELGILYRVGKSGERRFEEYKYFGVLSSVFDHLMAESRAGRSMGSAVDKLVKKAGFAYRRIERTSGAQRVVETPEMRRHHEHEKRALEMVVTAAHFGHIGGVNGDDWGMTRVKLLLCLGEKYQDAVRSRGEQPFVKIVNAGARHPTPEEYVRDAVLLERERCAALVDAELAAESGENTAPPQGVIAMESLSSAGAASVALRRVATAIRLGNPTKEMEP